MGAKSSKEVELPKDAIFFNEDPGVTHASRVPARAAFFAFESHALALAGERAASSRHVNLNGSWKFLWKPHFADLPDELVLDADVSDWPEIPVPGTWELNGYGYPIYVNTRYCFESSPPTIRFLGKDKLYNPTGAYRKTFEPPAQWLDQGLEVFLRIGAVASMCRVWLNGVELGFSTDSKLPCEFKLSPHLVKGQNVLAMKVVAWTTNAYLECQDTWWFTGITRDVEVYARPKQHLRDYTVRASAAGLLEVEAEVSNYSATSPATLACELLDSRQESLIKFNLSSGAKVSGKQQVATVKPWSAEDPQLYTLVLSLEVEGAVSETVRQRIGFRSIEIKDSRLHLNGSELILRGVNRSEFDCKTGRVISQESMREDIRLMKTNSFNAVRNSHHPMDPRWYELCDEYGLYVVDEVNIESHGISFDSDTTLANREAWVEAHLERTRRTFAMHKNFTSVIIWSLGNEAGNGVCFHATYDWLKNNDKSGRPVQFENAREEAGWSTSDPPTITYNTDIYCPMYPSPSHIEKYLSKAWKNDKTPRPIIMCEYAHAMGNSLGNFTDYWDIIHADNVCQGGFIWDWVDQGLAKQGAPPEQRVFLYGEDFGPHEFQSDLNFCCNGLVQPDRIPNPHLHEAKKVMQPVAFEKVDLSKGLVRVRNRYAFRSLEHLEFHWSLLTSDGEAAGEGKLPTKLDTAPRAASEITLALPCKDLSKCYVLIEARIRTEAATALVPAGHLEAWEQWPVGSVEVLPACPVAPPSTEKPAIASAGGKLVITSGRLTARISQETGWLCGLAFDKEELISDPLRLNLNRPFTDNDYGGFLPLKLHLWSGAHKRMTLIGAPSVIETAGPDGPMAEVRVQVNVSPYIADTKVYDFFAERGCGCKGVLASYIMICYKISAGRVHVSCHWDPRDALVGAPVNVGVMMKLVAGFEDVEWLGRGPHESYRDRYTSARVGKFRGSILDQTFKYCRPQATGNKWETRWMKLHRKLDDKSSCAGLLVAAEGPTPALPMNCFRYNFDDFFGPHDEAVLLKAGTDFVEGFAEGLVTGPGDRCWCGRSCAQALRPKGGAWW